jgi:hypothetical protein
MKASLKQGLAIIGVVVGASLAIQLPIVFAHSNMTPQPAYIIGVSDEVSPSPEPTPSVEPSVRVSPTATRTPVPPRTLSPDPRNTENGGAIGGFRGDPAPDRGNEFVCEKEPTSVRCQSKAP